MKHHGLDHEYYFHKGCGAYVCYDCDEHRDLVRCYCGWSKTGEDGYQVLIEMGEQVYEDD